MDPFANCLNTHLQVLKAKIITTSKPILQGPIPHYADPMEFILKKNKIIWFIK